MTASRGVSLMPQLKTAKPADHEAQCSTLLALRVLFALNVTQLPNDIYPRPPKDRVFGH